MNFIRIVLVAALAVGLTLFTYANWLPVTVNLGFGLELVTHLPVLVAVAMLLVALPSWLTFTTSRLLLHRRVARLQTALDRSEAALAQARVELLRPLAADAPLPASPPPPVAPRRADLPQALHLPVPPAGA